MNVISKTGRGGIKEERRRIGIWQHLAELKFVAATNFAKWERQEREREGVVMMKKKKKKKAVAEMTTQKQKNLLCSAFLALQCEEMDMRATTS